MCNSVQVAEGAVSGRSGIRGGFAFGARVLSTEEEVAGLTDLVSVILGAAALVWILLSDAKKMEVPLVALAVLGCAGAAWRINLGIFEETAYSAVVAAAFLIFLKRGAGEGDLLMLFALTPWFAPQVYVGVLAAGFALAATWGAARLAIAGEFKSWLAVVKTGTLGALPPTPEEGLKRPDCVPLAAALALPALAVILWQAVSPAVF